MQGMNVATGKPISGIDHLKQSVRDILTTPLGSRVMLRDYGSALMQLVDAPLNQGTMVELYAATVQALLKWEPRISVTSVSIQSVVSGVVTLSLTGNYLQNGQPITVDGISLSS